MFGRMNLMRSQSVFLPIMTGVQADITNLCSPHFIVLFLFYKYLQWVIQTTPPVQFHSGQ